MGVTACCGAPDIDGSDETRELLKSGILGPDNKERMASASVKGGAEVSTLDRCRNGWNRSDSSKDLDEVEANLHGIAGNTVSRQTENISAGEVKEEGGKEGALKRTRGKEAREALRVELIRAHKAIAELRMCESGGLEVIGNIAQVWILHCTIKMMTECDTFCA